MSAKKLRRMAIIFYARQLVAYAAAWSAGLRDRSFSKSFKESARSTVRNASNRERHDVEAAHS
jgi:hypothetical protein